MCQFQVGKSSSKGAAASAAEFGKLHSPLNPLVLQGDHPKKAQLRAAAEAAEPASSSRPAPEMCYLFRKSFFDAAARFPSDRSLAINQSIMHLLSPRSAPPPPPCPTLPSGVLEILILEYSFEVPLLSRGRRPAESGEITCAMMAGTRVARKWNSK